MKESEAYPMANVSLKGKQGKIRSKRLDMVRVDWDDGTSSRHNISELKAQQSDYSKLCDAIRGSRS